MSDDHLAVAATILLLLFHLVPLWSTLSGVLHTSVISGWLDGSLYDLRV